MDHREQVEHITATHQVEADICDLLDTDGELTPAQQLTLRNASEMNWDLLSRTLRQQAHVAYAVADPADLTFCLRQHLTSEDAQKMIVADDYTCPRCERVLKHRPR